MSRPKKTQGKRKVGALSRLLLLSLLGMMFVPSSANSNYLYEVLPPDLHPYVLLIVDNSGSMLCQDGLYDESGARTFEGLYQDAATSCHANYCRTADNRNLWVCPDRTEAQIDANSFGTCRPEQKGPWCNNTKTECETIYDQNCRQGPCAVWDHPVKCNERNGDCITMGTEEYDCEPGECLAWNQKQVCEDGACNGWEQVDGDVCQQYHQVPGPECETWYQVDGDVCLEFEQVPGPNCLEYNLMDGSTCLEYAQVDGETCIDWHPIDGDVCLVYEQVDGDVCLEYHQVDGPTCLAWHQVDGDICEEYNLVNGDCLEYNQKWIPPQYTGDECIRWDDLTRTTDFTCNLPNCRGKKCEVSTPKCKDTNVCESWGPEYDCQTEHYDCKEVCEIRGVGDNQWEECHTECKTRQVNCKRDCLQWKQSCTTTCDLYSYQQCGERSPKELVPGTGVWVEDTNSCKTYEQVNGSCKRWNQVDGTVCASYEQVDGACSRYNQVNGACTSWNQVPGPDCAAYEQVNGACTRWNQIPNPDSCRTYELIDGPTCLQWNQVDGTECRTYKLIDGECSRWNKVNGDCNSWEQVCHWEDDLTSCKDRGPPQNCKTRETECIEWEQLYDMCDVCKTYAPDICDPREECVTTDAPCDCPSRMETAQSVLQTLIPGLDNLTLGLARYGKFEEGLPRDIGSDGDVLNCGVRIDNPLPGDRDAILGGVATMVAEGGTPIAKSLAQARAHIAEVAASDPAATCRSYFVILVTDGEESCALDENYYADQAYLEAQVSALRNLSVDGVAGTDTIDVRTFILGFGPELASMNPELHSLSELARLGGTAEQDGIICTPRNKGEACAQGSALFALRRNELVDKLNAAFQKITEGEFAAQAPVIGSVAQEVTELGRVSRNFMVYSTFRQPGFSGHLYGIRLFTEDPDEAGLWSFTDLSEMDLDTCGAEGNPCIFDAGRMLTNRVKERRIFTSVPTSTLDDNNGGLTLPLTEMVELSNDSSGYQSFEKAFSYYSSLLEVPRLLGDDRPPSIDEAIAARVIDLDSAAGSADREAIVRWLHGETRSWKLGDIYHGGAAIVGAPPYSYRTRGYDQFKKALRDRPDMIYVGANDGMIHAFHAAPDLMEGAARWDQAGEEAWAYLPVNMLARASSAILEGYENEQRFFSQDLACRIDDVLVHDNVDENGDLDCGDDPLCGWRTVLLCGQGWGGSWFTALDVSDPFEPKPLWESTFSGADGDGSSAGIGKTWTIPSVGLFNLASSTSPTAPTVPTWGAVYGSGYNADMKDLSDTYYEAYRILNIPFDGAYAYHGNGPDNENAHVFVQNVANGRFLKVFHQHDDDLDVQSGAIVADIPLVDLDGDGFIDVAYVGNWSSKMDRIAFAKNRPAADEPPVIPLRTHPDEWDNRCQSLFDFGAGKPITSSPTVMVDPLVSQRVYLFAGAGVDRGSYPGEDTGDGSAFGFRGFLFDDNGSQSCPVAPGGTFQTTPSVVGFPSAGNLCLDENDDNISLSSIMNDNARILGSPMLTLQANTDRWLSFTAWKPEATSCAEGSALLYCLNVSNGTACAPCGEVNGSSTGEGVATSGRKPPPPASADGQLYVVGPDGPIRVGNQSGEEGGITGQPPRPNVNAPRAVVISWREIFEP